LPPKSLLVIDCGSTTTKALLFEPEGERYVIRARAESPTTVEKPVEDITLGVFAAVEQLEQITGRKMMDNGQFIVPQVEGQGVDFVGATCSAGGGLQILVAGVIKSMTAESAERAALGAGAIVADVISVDDGRDIYEKLARIGSIKPDMILVSGGVDGGNVTHVVRLAELLYAAGVRPRHGIGRIPVIYAGNTGARQHFRDILSGVADMRIVDNLRPQLEHENTAPARQEIQDTFMSHVMIQAPHYAQLAELMSVPILPTPVAVGKAIEYIGQHTQLKVLACDIGGATTDLFSYSAGRLLRTVSANLGMSYSIYNVITEGGLQTVKRFLPFPTDDIELGNTFANKMIRPGSIPATPAELAVEQAVARVVLSLALKHHQELNRDVRGVQRRRDISQMFSQDSGKQSLVSLMDVELLIGSGSVLSLAPRRSQAAAMLVDGLQPEGVTHLAVDSQFVLPQLGLISSTHSDIAWQVLLDSALVRLGTVIAPVGQSATKGLPLVKITLRSLHSSQEVLLRSGDLFVIPYRSSEPAHLEVKPLGGVDVGAGPGKSYSCKTHGGAVGIILDGRGRPLKMPSIDISVREMLLEAQALNLYQPEVIADFARRGGIRL